jgi:hypothetical protein
MKSVKVANSYLIHYTDHRQTSNPLLYISPTPVHMFAFDQYSVMVLADSITAATLYHHLVCAACVACSSRHQTGNWSQTASTSGVSYQVPTKDNRKIANHHLLLVVTFAQKCWTRHGGWFPPKSLDAGGSHTLHGPFTLSNESSVAIMSSHGSYKAHWLFIEIFTRGGERSVVKGKKRSHGLSPSLMSMHPAQCQQMLLLDFLFWNFCWTSESFLFAQKPRMQETLKHGPSTCPTSQDHATTSSAPKKPRKGGNSFRKIGRQLEGHTEQECVKLFEWHRSSLLTKGDETGNSSAIAESLPAACFFEQLSGWEMVDDHNSKSTKNNETDEK